MKLNKKRLQRLFQEQINNAVEYLRNEGVKDEEIYSKLTSHFSHKGIRTYTNKDYFNKKFKLSNTSYFTIDFAGIDVDIHAYQNKVAIEANADIFPINYIKWTNALENVIEAKAKAEDYKAEDFILNEDVKVVTEKVYIEKEQPVNVEYKTKADMFDKLLARDLNIKN